MSTNPSTLPSVADREILKADLVRNAESGEQDYFALQARCVRAFGPAAGIFIRQLVFWYGKGMDETGWIYKSCNEMQAETGLSRRQQDKARKLLVKKGVLEEELRGVPPHRHYRVMHFRVKLKELHDALSLLPTNIEHEPRSPNIEQELLPGNSGSELLPTNIEQELLPDSTEQTTEITSGENPRVTSEATSERNRLESTFQVARNGRFAPTGKGIEWI